MLLDFKILYNVLYAIGIKKCEFDYLLAFIILNKK